MNQRPLDVEAFQKRFGEVVRRHRQMLSISQEELADRCGLHRTYISEIERGRKSASLKALLAIASSLGCPPHVLIKEAEDLLND
ncbi:MAG: helix-turn-helix domain-containing protein [Heteroscytonema crispum UTEX LB 1556]